MIGRVVLGGLAALALGGMAAAAPPPVLVPAAKVGAAVRPYVKVDAPVVVLRHVRLIDGTGAAAQADRTIVLRDGRIAEVGPAALRAPKGAVVLDLTGHTVLPGIVGLHDHMYYIARPNLDAHGHSEPPLVVPQMTFSSPRLYLAAGVTTLRTTGSVEPYADLNVKRQIDEGVLPGPHMDVTGPYLEGPNSPFIQMHQLRDDEDARRTVAFWADQGATSFKAYMNITRSQLKAAIDEAHRRGLKVTGHLCSVTYPEAAELGIDNLEHGFFVNTQLDPGKQPDLCPATAGAPTLLAMDPDGPEAAALIRLLVEKKVAVTSTLPVFEQRVPGHAPLDAKAMAVLTPQAREAYLYARNLTNTAPPARAAESQRAFRNALAMERKFVAAGGLLVAGPDPTGNGGVIPGFGNHRNIALLVEAGFTLEEAVRIATLNGATYLGLADRIGSVAPGKNADLMVVKGDPGKAIGDLGNVEIVFKDGVGFDAPKLLQSVQGRYGQY
ncbi:amidohydrolase family protein [Phenylobacterium sp.]|uniref:amidohydrolase family protein n=1 Tax=Phenylobacterium sp. TaxID=1871053 RepID=UPI002F9271C2